MILRIIAALALVMLTGCVGSQDGILVSRDAEPLGGGLFVETLPDGDQVLVLDGEITGETSFTFQSLLQLGEVSGLIIAQSPGGNLLAAHQIGRAIKENRINTAVIASCQSACVDVFIAGVERSIVNTAELGLHAAVDPELGYSLTDPYWTSFGLSAVNDAAYEVPFESIWIIDAERALELRLATEILD